MQQCREAAEEDDCGGDGEQDGQRDGVGFDGRIVDGGHDVGALEDLQIVVEGDGAHGDGEGDKGEWDWAGGDAEDGGEEIELGPEADQRRDAGERKEEDQKDGGEKRVALVEAEEGVELVGAGGALDDGDYAEGADGGEAVGEDVVEDGVGAGKRLVVLRRTERASLPR